MSELPLIMAVNKHIEKESISFHVPGHKNGLIYGGPEEFKKFLVNDLTELTNLDDLHSPSGAIADAEKRLTNLYKSVQSFFLVGGSTVGNLSMALATLKCESKVLVQRNSHKSIFNALKLVKASPIFISPEIDEDLCVAKGLSFENVKLVIELNPDAKVMILTYPNYYGQVYDLKKIINLAHSKGILVLVDEAHGAHFLLGKPFPLSSLSFGADIVVQSAHKTLPAMTMGSWIHVNSERVSVKKVREYLEMLQSSSPSYPIMMSLDGARNYLEDYSTTDIMYTLSEIKKFKENLNEISGIKIIETDDPLKLIIQSSKTITGKQLQDLFEENGVFPELADHKNVLLVLPLLKNGVKYPFEKAIIAIKKSIDKTLHYLEKEYEYNQIFESKPFSELEFPYSKIESCEEIYILLEEAIGNVSAETIIPYPPGIPLIIRGEKITRGMIDSLEVCLGNNIKLHGGANLSNRKILVFL